MEHGAQRIELLFAERSGVDVRPGQGRGGNLEVEWPSGAKQQFEGVGANQRVSIDEARGLKTLP